MLRCCDLALLFAIALHPGIAAASLLERLSSRQADDLRGGEPVVVTEDLKGYPWPRVSMYRVIDAKPEEVMAVFFDYNGARDFIPNCRKSAIAKTINSCTHEIDYEVAVPILPDEAYTVRNVLDRPGGEQLRVSWKLIKATSIQESEGSMVVEPYGEKSLICYVNLVKPGCAMASLLKRQALGQMKETLAAIANRVILRKQNRPDALKAEVVRLMDALGARE